jgi:purine nucleoside permease
MTTWTLIAASLITLLCGGILAIGADAMKRRAISQRERAVAERRRELAPLASIYAEVARFEADKDWLQHQIDIINGFMQSRTPWLVPLQTTQRIAVRGIEIDRVTIAGGLDLTTGSPAQAAAAAVSMSRLRFVIGDSVTRPTDVVVEGS